jgi:hypothetical protein
MGGACGSERSCGFGGFDECEWCGRANGRSFGDAERGLESATF